MERITPTAEQLQLAFEQMRRRDWPATFDEAMQNPLCAALLRGQAVRQLLRAQYPAGPPAAPSPAPPRPSRAVPVPTHAPVFDRKRAASGDRDEE